MTWPSLTAPVPALPLDLLRIMVGLLAAAYFARTWREAPLFSGPRGLLDHDLVRRVLPFTRLSLFPPGASIRTLRAMFAVGCMASLLLAAGIMPQASALVAYVIAVSTYRWNLPLMYVDDAIVHLALFWMVLLPVGTTLAMPDVVADPATAWAGARIETVPGFTVRCFLANLALVYLVAGLWKWSSPLWRRGWALYAVLRMAASYAPDWWRPRPAAPMRVANWFALAIEAPLALLLVLPPGSPVKLALGAGAVAFHLGILVTMKFPFANLAMLGALVVFFGDEVTGFLGAPPPPGAVATATLAAADALAAFTVACLALLFLLNAVWYRDGATVSVAANRRTRGLNPLYIPLWVIGLAQSYRLFDWIDERNFRVDHQVLSLPARPLLRPEAVDPNQLFPRSMRDILLQSYLYGNLWVRVNPDALPELRSRMLAGYAREYARRHPADAEVEACAIVQRITPDNLDLRRGTPVPLLRFSVRGGESKVTLMALEPPQQW